MAGFVLLLPDRVPVPGARVTFQGYFGLRQATAPPAMRETRTGPDGAFRLGGFAPGECRFLVEVEGRAPRSFGVLVAEGTGAPGVEVLFGGGGNLEGLVCGAGGSPLARAAVRAERETYGGAHETRTGPDGVYRLADLPAGAYSLRVAGSGGSSRARPVAVIEGATTRVDFAGAASVAGTVADEEGAPLAGAIVRATKLEGGFHCWQTVTGEDGSYGIEEIEPGTWTLGVQVLGPGAFSADLATAAIVPGPQRIDLRLGAGEAAGQIGGRVCSKETGMPVPGTELQITLHVLAGEEGGPRRVGDLAGMAFADDRGNFRFRALRPGRYRLLVHSRGPLAGAERDLVLGPGERIQGLEFALEPAPPSAPRPRGGNTLAGTVRAGSGAPVAGAFVRAFLAGPVRTLRQDRTDDSGRYLLEALEPGEWRISVQVVGDQGYSVEVGTVGVRPGANAFDVQLERGEMPGEVAGRLLRAADGRPLGSREISSLMLVPLVAPGLGAASLGSGGALAFPDAGGGFRFRSIRPGRWLLAAFPRDGTLRVHQCEVDLPPGGKLEGLEIRMEPFRGGTAILAVRDAAGAPVANGGVMEIRADGSVGLHWVDSPRAGEIAVRLPAGRRRLLFRDEAKARSAEVVVDVEEGGTVRVEVVLPGGG